MQYVAGSDAHHEFDQGRLTAQRAVYIIGEVAKALDHAHRRNLVHRDVKPANFLLGPDDERVLLADFGIARALDEGVGLTATGTVMATVAYAAPETLGSGHVDGRADIYALGCSLYRMLTGQTPFASSGGAPAVIAAHLSAPPPRVTDRVNTLPPALDAVIAKALAKDPAQRYQTAGQLAGDAAAALEAPVTSPVHRPARPAAQPPPTPHAQPTGWSPQRPPPASAPVTYPSGYFSGAQPGPPTMFDQGQTPQPPRPVGGSSPRHRRIWVAAALSAVVLIAAAAVGAVKFNGGGKHPGYQPQSFDTVHGTTRIENEPHAVAALSPSDGDAVLSLGVQPVTLVAPDGLPEWEKQLLTTDTKVSPSIDTAAIAATQPDAIIATTDIDKATYNALSDIAPTVTRPQDAGPGWSWHNQLSWIGRVLGRGDKAKQLIDTAHGQQDELRSHHAAFDDQGIAAVNVDDNGFTATVRPSSTSNYLEGLGFHYIHALDRTAFDSGDVRHLTYSGQYQTWRADVLLVLRTDKAAGGGDYNGLPQEFATYTGTEVIVDDPDAIAALNTGGYAAAEYLNSHLVNTLARQVH
jgi:serine/threonine-protein kinase